MAREEGGQDEGRKVMRNSAITEYQPAVSTKLQESKRCIHSIANLPLHACRRWKVLNFPFLPPCQAFKCRNSIKSPSYIIYTIPARPGKIYILSLTFSKNIIQISKLLTIVARLVLIIIFDPKSTLLQSKFKLSFNSLTQYGAVWIYYTLLTTTTTI